jgi:hypothetical protein
MEVFRMESSTVMEQPKRTPHLKAKHAAKNGGRPGGKLVSPSMLCRIWGLSKHVINSWFENEPGVIVWERKLRGGNRGNKTYRIPPEVAERVRLRHTIAEPPGDEAA